MDTDAIMSADSASNQLHSPSYVTDSCGKHRFMTHRLMLCCRNYLFSMISNFSHTNHRAWTP